MADAFQEGWGNQSESHWVAFALVSHGNTSVRLITDHLLGQSLENYVVYGKDTEGADREDAAEEMNLEE